MLQDEIDTTVTAPGARRGGVRARIGTWRGERLRDRRPVNADGADWVLIETRELEGSGLDMLEIERLARIVLS